MQNKINELKTIETNQGENSREKVLKILEKLEGVDLGKEISKIINQYILEEINKDPLCNKYLNKSPEYNQSYESFYTRTQHREENNFQLENEIKDYLNQIYEDEMTQCQQDFEFEKFKTNIEQFLTTMFENENLVLSGDTAEQINKINDFLNTENIPDEDLYLSSLMIQNELIDVLIELQSFNKEINFDNLIAELENTSELKVPEFSEGVSAILDHQLNAKIGNYELLELNSAMVEFLQKNIQYEQIWEDINERKPVNTTELNKFVYSFSSFSKISLTLILASIILTGCSDMYDKDGRKRGLYVEGDKVMRAKSDLGYSRQNGQPFMEAGSPQEFIANEVRLHFEKEGENIGPISFGYDVTNNINDQQNEIPVVPQLQFSIQSKDPVYISFIQYGQNVWTKPVLAESIQNRISATGKIKVFTKNSDGAHISVQYDKPQESDGLALRLWDTFFSKAK